MVLDDGARDRGAAADRIPLTAPGIGYVIEDGSPTVTKVRAGFVDDDQLAWLAETYPTPSRLVPDVIDGEIVDDQPRSPRRLDSGRRPANDPRSRNRGRCRSGRSRRRWPGNWRSRTPRRSAPVYGPAVRRIDTTTGQATVVPIPCGATRTAVCGPCAARARRLRMHQAREGWHRSEEPKVVTKEPTVRQRALLGQRADLENDHAAARGRRHRPRPRPRGSHRPGRRPPPRRRHPRHPHTHPLRRGRGRRGTDSEAANEEHPTASGRPPTCPVTRSVLRPPGGCSRPPTAGSTGRRRSSL
jgi:hypothetical protein